MLLFQGYRIPLLLCQRAEAGGEPVEVVRKVQRECLRGSEMKRLYESNLEQQAVAPQMHDGIDGAVEPIDQCLDGILSR